MPERVSVLVVEDDPAWRSALTDMYNRILRTRCDPDITVVSNGDDALRALDKNRYALLSCDINLSQSGVPASTIDGRTILQHAAEKRRVAGVVVPTAISHDTLLNVVVPEETERARLELGAWLRRWYGPAGFLKLDKTATGTPRESVDVWADSDEIRDAIIALTHAWPSIPPPYTITFRGSEARPRILIRTTGSKTLRYYEVPRPDDARFLYELCVCAGVDAPISAETVGVIYNSSRPQMSVDSLTRQLRLAGIDPDALYEKRRGEGWMKISTVHLRGFASVNQYDADPNVVTDSRSTPEERLLRSVGAEAEVGEELERALNDLGETERAVVMARFIDEMPVEDIAAAEGYGVREIETLLRAALDRLRDLLKR